MNKDTKMLAEAYDDVIKLNRQVSDIDKNINNIINWLDKNSNDKTFQQEDSEWYFKGGHADGVVVYFNKKNNTFDGYYSSEYSDDTIDMDTTTNLSDIQKFIETSI
jgi:hypothetical protein